MAKLFIGMPIYNGERFIGRSIASIQEQTFRDWTMLISDNASTDKTADICKRISAEDKRIRYIRQEKNIGGEANFKFLLGKADAPYFMWASDDLWEKGFIESCLNLLEHDKECGLAFSNILNIDSLDRTIRDYPSFSRFVSINRWEQVSNYLLDPEKQGKANLLYSVFRLDVCKEAWASAPFDGVWGSEMCFITGALARSKFALDERVLFQKRIITNSPELRKIQVHNPHERLFPLEHADAYIEKTIGALQGTEFYELGKKIMEVRRNLVEAQTALRKKERIIRILRHPLRTGLGVIRTLMKKQS